MKPCKHCGSPLDNNAPTCTKCGRSADDLLLNASADRSPGKDFSYWDVTIDFLLHFIALPLGMGIIGFLIGGWVGFAIGVLIGVLPLFVVAS